VNPNDDNEKTVEEELYEQIIDYVLHLGSLECASDTENDEATADGDRSMEKEEDEEDGEPSEED
jgi:hypothetical protein